MSTQTQLPELPPGTWPRASHLARAVKRPIDRFLQLEAASGILLLAATAGALAWANSPWAGSYEALWRTPVHVGAGAWTGEVTLQFVINDILMAVFFFSVGLEIRRELHDGELRDARRAALPVIAAIGGMIVPAALYLMVNGGDLQRGWGIPIATDIAFALGILALLGSRVTASMRVFLLTLAIIDDIGAILVIAIFYSHGVQLHGLGIALAGAVVIVALQRLGARSSVFYALPAVAIWLGTYLAGVHPTIAGVLVGLMTPAARWYGPQEFIELADENIRSITEHGHSMAEPMRHLSRVQLEMSSPVERLEDAVHPWVAFLIMPLFAFANAGVRVADVQLAAMPTVSLGIALGLVLGKPLGILAATSLAARLRIARLTSGLTWQGIAVIGIVAGVGFTMALFIAELALGDATDLLASAKLAVLLASACAAGAALLSGRILLASDPEPVREPRSKRVIPEFERGPLAYVLLVLGTICAALELGDTDRIHGRLILFVLVALAGLIGILRGKRTPERDQSPNGD